MEGIAPSMPGAEPAGIPPRKRRRASLLEMGDTQPEGRRHSSAPLTDLVPRSLQTAVEDFVRGCLFTQHSSAGYFRAGLFSVELA